MIAIVSAISGKYLSEIGLRMLGAASKSPVKIPWWVSFVSAYIESFSHVLLDSIVHTDVEPFYPVILNNGFHGFLSFSALHELCIYSAVVGATIYYVLQWRSSKV